MKLNKIKLALAEVNPIQRLLIRSLVRQGNVFELVLEAENGDDLLIKIQNSATLPLVCITDLHMPVMNGSRC